MSSVNKAIIIGNLTKDPETRKTDNSQVSNFSLATNEKYKNKQGEVIESVEYHNVVLWGKLSELAEKYLNKGSKIYLEGKIVTRKWQDKEENTRYTTEIEGRQMTFLGSKSDSASEPASAPKTAKKQTVKAGGDDEDDDLPF